MLDELQRGNSDMQGRQGRRNSREQWEQAQTQLSKDLAGWENCIHTLSFAHTYSTELDTVCECVCVRCDSIGLRLCWLFDADSYSVAVDLRFKQAWSVQVWLGVQRSFQTLLPRGQWSSHCPGLCETITRALLILWKMHSSTRLISITISTNPLNMYMWRNWLCMCEDGSYFLGPHIFKSSTTLKWLQAMF